MPEDTPTPSDSNGEQSTREGFHREESTPPTPPQSSELSEPSAPPIPPQPGAPGRTPFDTVLTPIANPTDGRETARAVRAYLPPEATVYVAHVVQKGEGVPDKAGVEQRLAFAERAYEAFATEFDRASASAAPTPSATPVTLYGRNVPRTILAGARDVRATAVVFTPRGAGRWTKLLTGSVTEGLLRESELPVIALPRLRERLVLD